MGMHMTLLYIETLLHSLDIDAYTDDPQNGPVLVDTTCTVLCNVLRSVLHNLCILDRSIATQYLW